MECNSFSVGSEIPRPEHPFPQAVRESWLNLNGQWQFQMDPGCSALDRNVYLEDLSGETITVPFCPESKLSGIGHVDFIDGVVYQRRLELPEAWQGKRVLLHFGGVDCDCRVFLDDREVGAHSGGQTAFTVDLTEALREGVPSYRLTVVVQDHLRTGLHGSGKQSPWYGSRGCFYTRVTGIWQTVWLEAIAPEGLKDFRIETDYDRHEVQIRPSYFDCCEACTLTGELLMDGQVVATESVPATGMSLRLIPQVVRDWSPDDPFLYDLKLTVTKAGQAVDEVSSYVGLRKIEWRNGRLFLNNQPIFLRFVLDQGFYPDGIWTAPTDEALRRDIEMSKAAGFNGARLHQKVFEPRFHYHADRLGYLTWAEYGSWGMDLTQAETRTNFLREWAEAVRQNQNHPSIVGWTPLNETCSFNEPSARIFFPITQERYEVYENWIRDIYLLTHALDGSRPVNDVSGYLHVKTDLWTVHAYRPDAKQLAEALFPASEPVMRHAPEYEPAYEGQPYLNDEFGGFKYIPKTMRTDGEEGWGYYGQDLQTEEDFLAKLREQVELMVAEKRLAGYCYTQLFDVEQEQNGLYAYDRTPKCEAEQFAEIFGKKPDWSRW